MPQDCAPPCGGGAAVGGQWEEWVVAVDKVGGVCISKGLAWTGCLVLLAMLNRGNGAACGGQRTWGWVH